MKATRWWAAMLGLSLAASLAAADPYYPTYPCYPRAPDMCGSASFCTNPYGGYYGPSYNVYPPFPPVQGISPGCMPKCQIPAFPVHPYLRSPRDYFMMD
jgi:hypothetical protein